MKRPEITVKNYTDFVLRKFWADPTPTLKRGMELLETPFYLHSGTALGVHRDQDFIEYDSDVDVAINLEWEQDHYMLTAELVRRFTGGNFRLMRSLIMDDKPAQLVFTDENNEGIWLDIEFYYSGLVDDHHIHHKPNGYLKIPSELVEATKTRTFKGLEVPLPEKIEEYLEMRYGKTWRTPMQKKGRWEDYTPVFHEWL